MPFDVSYWLFVVVCFILKGLSTGQQFWNQEFVFAIPTVESHNTPRILISTTIDTPVDVQVLVTGIDFVTNTNVTRSQHTEIILPTSAQLSGHGRQNRTIIVRSSVFISVHGRNDDYSNPDGFLALPNSQQGLEFYIASYTPWTYGQSQFSISSQAKETRVHIETAQGAIEDIVLQPYESYQYLSGTDLTGTRVEADNPVTVMAGVDKAIIPVDITGWDSILEQLPPTNLWGVQFVVGPFAGVPAEYRFRIIAGNETVQVKVSGSSIRILKRNFYEGSGSGVTTITSDKPVLVVQYMPNGSPGAACMVLVSPKQLYVGNMMIFPVYPATFRYITLIVHCDMLEGFILNEDELIKNWDMLSTTDRTMCALSKQVEEGTYIVRHSNKEVRFTGYVYGYNFAYAYAYPAGVGYIPDVALHFDSATVSVSEGDETLTLVVTNEGGESTMIALATIDIETTENSDYTSKDGQILEIGGYVNVTFDVDITDDNSAELPERFDVTFMEVSTGETITCRVTILDDDYVSSTLNHHTLPTEGCPSFAIPDDGTVQPIEDSYNFGQTVTVYCRSGFNLIGDETLVCLESGVWHGELPKCSPQSTNGRRISNTVLISAATTGCAVFVFIVVVVIVCFFCKRKRKSDDKTPYYTTHIEMSPKERQETSPGSIDGVYSNPLDNNGYQDLQMPPPATNYHELYTEVPDRVYVQS